MNHTPLDIIKTKQLRGNMIEALYRYYGEDQLVSSEGVLTPCGADQGCGDEIRCVLSWRQGKGVCEAGLKQDKLHGFPDLADAERREPCGGRSAGCRSGY